MSDTKKSAPTLTGIEEIRKAAALLDWIDEDAMQKMTAEQVLNVARAHRASGWDVLPDQWSQRQLGHAAHAGAKGAPRFVETDAGLEAIHVACVDCSRAARGAR